VKMLMLVSAPVTSSLRDDAARGTRPRPEYLSLEGRYGVDLLDWTRLGLSGGHRSVVRSLTHALAGLRRARGYDVVFSDGEHLGIPLGAAMSSLRMRIPHLMIGHNLLAPAKARLLRYLSIPGVDLAVVHSAGQIDRIVSATAIPRTKLAVVPYGVDTRFWSSLAAPAASVETDLVVSAGREHRDYRTLVEALPPDARMCIADHSLFTPRATREDPAIWPATVERVGLDPAGLRDLYAKAAVVVVPVVETLMPAGITTLLEAMSMGKALVVTDTSGLRGIVEHGRTGLVVPPGDPRAMRAAITQLLASPDECIALGTRARQEAVARYDVEVFTDALGACFARLSDSGCL
jgi:glycosyltransferase involved in cell wall biosynthesis